MAARGAQNGRQGLERDVRSRQLLLNNSFDPSTPPMRKGHDGEKWKKRMENNDVYSGHLRRCQLTARTMIDWNAAGSCQNT